MKKQHLWKGVSPRERGVQAEEKFFEAWADTKHYPQGMHAIVRPTLEEDICEKTDALIIYSHGPRMRIQIKSYWQLDLERIALMEYGVVPLSILPHQSLQSVRMKTLLAITDFKVFESKKSLRLCPDLKPCDGNMKWYYKKGKKIYRQ